EVRANRVHLKDPTNNSIQLFALVAPLFPFGSSQFDAATCSPEQQIELQKKTAPKSISSPILSPLSSPEGEGSDGAALDGKR
ncbi:2073_t:CDS:2, partial [Ambispora leptoticha]